MLDAEKKVFAMRNRVAVSVAGLVAAGALLFAPTASAAVEAGNTCGVNGGEEDTFTGFSLSSEVGNPIPTAVPVAGVITQWKTNVSLELPAGLFSEALQVFRPTSSADKFQLIGQSASAPISSGLNVFPTRVPGVQPGDRIGTFGAVAALFCQTEKANDQLAYIEGGISLGAIGTFKTVAGYQAAVSARIEADVDNDGYGDETQDLCPQSAAYQTPCPVVTLDAFSTAGSSAVKVLVATSTEAPVSISGTVKLGKDGKAKLSAKAKAVPAGKIVSFTLKFPTKLKDKLKELTPSQKLQLKITASATNVAGQISTDNVKAKLKGQG